MNTDSLQVACAHCLTPNRVPRSRLAETPKCGRCGEVLLDGRPASLSEAGFDAFVGRTRLPVLVDFWAPWCGPCRAMAPDFERAAAEQATTVRYAKVNTEEAQTLAARMGIRAIPTLILFRDGKEVDRASGAMNAAALKRWVAKHV